MVPDSYHDFFVASASAAGALVGLLFVALSIFRDRDDVRDRVEAHSLRASAAFTVFSNTLVVSLFALLPGDDLGVTATIVSVLGVAFVIASVMRLLRLRRSGFVLSRRDLIFIVGSAALFAWQMRTAVQLWIDPRRSGLVDELGVIVVICFTYGIARAWELIGGPQVGVVSEVQRLLADPPAGSREADPSDTERPAGRRQADPPDANPPVGSRDDEPPDADPRPAPDA